VVPEAKHLPVLDLEVLAEMAEAGAKVVNAQAVEWARRSKVAIVARRTSDPIEGAARETISREASARNVRAIVGVSNVLVARTPSPCLKSLLGVLANLELPLGDLFSTREETFVHLPLLNVPDWSRCSREIDQAMAGAVTFSGPHSVASVVGFGLTGAAL